MNFGQLFGNIDTTTATVTYATVVAIHTALRHEANDTRTATVARTTDGPKNAENGWMTMGDF